MQTECDDLNLGHLTLTSFALQWFAVNSINDGFFRMRTALVPGAHSGLFTGKITAAVAFCTSYLVGVTGRIPEYIVYQRMALETSLPWPRRQGSLLV